jgi:hypothetical protein
MFSDLLLLWNLFGWIPLGFYIGNIMYYGSVGDANRRTLGFVFKPVFYVHCRFMRANGDHITGYKWARLVAYGDELRFQPIYNMHPEYDVESTAMCEHGNQVPASDCKCGFYALKRRQHLGYVLGTLSNQVVRSRLMTLEVDLSGRVLVANMGYRAEKQRVLRVLVPTRCAFRHEKRRRRRAAGVAIYKREVLAVCQDCAPSFMPLSVIADALGTEVVWAQKRSVV